MINYGTQRTQLATGERKWGTIRSFIQQGVLPSRERQSFSQHLRAFLHRKMSYFNTQTTTIMKSISNASLPQLSMRYLTSNSCAASTFYLQQITIQTFFRSTASWIRSHIVRVGWPEQEYHYSLSCHSKWQKLKLLRVHFHFIYFLLACAFIFNLPISFRPNPNPCLVLYFTNI